MLEARELYLINAGIDGELAPEERAELEAVLRSSGEARTLQAELHKLASLMDGMPEQEPPADLTHRILQSIKLSGKLPGRLPARRSAGGSKWSLAGLLSSFQPVPAGLAFAAGLLLAVGFFAAGPRSGETIDLSHVVGTMLANPADTPAQEEDSLSIQAPGLSGTVSLSALGDFMILNFDLESMQQTEILVGLAEAGLGFGGIARASADGAADDESYAVSGGTLRVVNPGSHPFAVFLRRPGAENSEAEAIAIEVKRDGESVFAGSLRFEGQGG
jgi:hypothetical protein